MVVETMTLQELTIRMREYGIKTGKSLSQRELSKASIRSLYAFTVTSNEYLKFIPISLRNGYARLDRAMQADIIRSLLVIEFHWRCNIRTVKNVRSPFRKMLCIVLFAERNKQITRENL